MDSNTLKSFQVMQHMPNGSQAVAIVIAGCLTVWTGAVSAQVDAGSLQQQIDREQQFRLPRLLPPTQPKRPQAQPPSAGPRITVSQFRITGNTIIATAELERVAAPYLGRPLSFADLEEVAARVAERYREAGWTVRVFLPEQDIVNGVVTIQVIEAVMGSVRIEGTVPRPSSLQSLRDIIEASQPAGRLMSAAGIDRGLLIANDISGVYVSGNLVEGEKEAETDLLLKALEKPFLESNISHENTGSYATGSRRTAAMFSVNNFAAPGGLLNTQLAHTAGSKYGRAAATFPIGLQGFRLGMNASRLDYDVISLPKELQANGNSTTTGLDLSYPLIRSRASNLYLNLAADQKDFTNFALGNLSSKYSSRVFSLTALGNRETELMGQSGVTVASIGLSSGAINLTGSPNEETLAKDANPAGKFTKVRFNLSQEQTLTQDISVFAAVSGQWASKNLDSSEKFTLGGSSGIRAYGSGEAAGATGQMANVELRWRVIPAVTIAGFYDVGSVQINVRNDYRGAPELNRYYLRGGGLSANWIAAEGLSFRASWARRTGLNPNANVETGKDQDGSLVINRVWLSASLSF